MKILLSNKYYYPRGGSDVYSIELEKLLKKNGHDVAVFAMQHQLNLQSEYSHFFPSEMDMNHMDLNNIFRSIIRPFGSFEVRNKFRSLLQQFKPDIVHLNNIHSHLSPVLAVIARKMNIPVVWTIHDHKFLCPRYDCVRDNRPCELCFTSKYNVIRYKCMKNSLAASLIAFAEAIIWNRKTISRSTDIFISPSSFLLKNMTKGGFDGNKLINIPNFINDKKIARVVAAKQNHYCYVGRLSTEKGIETLLKAAMKLPQYELKVIGTGPLEDELKSKYRSKHIEFLGFRKWIDICSILGSSRCMVVPSECYENNPLSAIESLCLGTPVIGSQIGGIPELIIPGMNGLLFDPGNVNDLITQITNIYEHSASFDYNEIAHSARPNFTSINYYNKIIEVYTRLLDKTTI